MSFYTELIMPGEDASSILHNKNKYQMICVRNQWTMLTFTK